MSITSPVNFTSLPPEVVTQIVSLLPRFAVLPLRCVNRQLELSATPFAFHSLRLQAFGNSPGHFMAIAESEKLSLLVREVTCDTWIGPKFEYRSRERFQIPHEFLTALPFLGSLPNLKALHLRFHQDCAGHHSERKVEETVDFRYRILDTIFQCLAGTWSDQRQRELDQSFGPDSVFAGHQSTQISATKITRLPSLNTLTISNLADFNDLRLTGSDAFKTVLGSGSLTDLRLFVTTDISDSGRRLGWNSPYSDNLDMFESLPATGVLPVASNLRTLSLYSRGFWGWHPKADFRRIGPLPQLKVLALGKYTFSHQWQVDWVASLGLEELYLDDCHVLYQAQCPMPMDESTEVIGKDDKGDDIVISNEGYIRRDVESAQDPTFKKLQFPLRWHTIFSHWRTSMLSLKVFKMGRGVWKGAPKETFNAAAEGITLKPDGNYEAGFDAAVLSHALEHNVFRYFDCPAPGSSGEKYRHGTGISKVNRLEYFYCYKMAGEWVGWEDWIDWRILFAGVREWSLDGDHGARDEAALSLFMSTMEGRRSSHVVA